MSQAFHHQVHGMPPFKTTIHFLGITLYFVLMGPVFALCVLIAQDAILRLASDGATLPNFSNYIFALKMYWPATFISCMVPSTVVGYAYAGYLYSKRNTRQLSLLKPLTVAALLGLAGGVVMGGALDANFNTAVAGCLAAAACSGMLWALGIGRPAG